MSFATDSPGARLEKILGLLDETAPSTDTAESGLNGRMQRIAQRLTTVDGRIDGLEAAIGAVADAAVIAPGSSASVIAALKGLLTANGPAYEASATFTPAAASHTAGDINGVAAEFALSLPTGRYFHLHSASITINGGTAEATGWFLYLFNVTPPSALADGDAFTLASGDRASFLGRVSLGTALDIGDTQFLQTHNINAMFKLSGTSVFGYLVNDTTLTPAAVAHIVKLTGYTR